MATTETRKTSRAIGTTPTIVDTYVVPAATTATCIGLSLANVSGSAITVTATLTTGATDTHIIKDAPIPAGSTLVVVGGDQRLSMITNDSIEVTSSLAASVDVIMSVLEHS